MKQYISKSAVGKDREIKKGKARNDSSFSNRRKTALQDSKTVELGGIIYKPVPAKTNDKICKDCHYFLDNGRCTLEECPCGDGLTILERVTKPKK